MIRCSTFHQLHRQPVQQLWVRRGFALGAEVLAGAHDSVSEIGLPDAVDNGSGRGGRAAVDQPTSESQAVKLRSRRQRMEEGRHTWPDRPDRLQEVTTLKQAGTARSVPLAEYELGR